MYLPIYILNDRDTKNMVYHLFKVNNLFLKYNYHYKQKQQYISDPNIDENL